MPEADINAESLEVLQIVISRFGIKALADSSILEGICEDRLSDFPKEASLLVTAAKSDVVALLQQQVNAVGVINAIKLAADSLTAKSSISNDASLWVVSQYARVLGYEVDSQALPVSASPTVRTGPILEATQPPIQFTPGPINDSSTIVEAPTPQLPRVDQQMIGQAQPFDYSNQGQPSVQPTAQQFTTNQTAPPYYVSAPPTYYPQQPQAMVSKSNNKSLIILAIVILLVVAYFVIAGTAHLPPFAKTSSTTTVSSPTTTLGNSGTTSTSTTIVSGSNQSYLNRLQSYIPTTLQQSGSCTQGSTIKSGAVVAITCNASSAANLPITQEEYLIFSSNASLYTYYNYLLSKYGITQNQTSCGNFTSFVVNCEEAYSVSSVNRGRISEFSYQKTPFIVSTVDNQDIVVGSIGHPGANGDSLINWWQSTANWDSLFG